MNGIKHILILWPLIILFFLPSAGASSQEETSFREAMKLDRQWTGDFDGMVNRRVIRALVTFSKTYYFLDKADQRGIAYELLKEFEKTINKDLKLKKLRLHLVIIPVSRDQIISSLIEGLGDIAAAGLITIPERKNKIDFAEPFITGVDEIVVATPGASKLTSIEDLSGKEIYVRKSSSYYESLSSLNLSFRKAGKPLVNIKETSEYLEDEDLLEMVNAGIISMTVVNSYLAKFWSQIFKKMKIYSNIHVNTGGEIAWVIRKNSPKLKRVIGKFVKGHKKGTLFGNIMFKRYLQNTKWVLNPLTDEDINRFEAAIGFFRKYAERYQLDWIMVAALAYQESRIDQGKRSPAGALGVMQLLPSTAAGHPIRIPDIDKMEKNIHAGVKYLRWIHDTYFKDKNMDKLNRALFTFASYNAGPARISRLRKQAEKMNLDPNKWFGNVEVAAAKKIGRETVQYVSNIYKYFVAYRLIVEKMGLKKEVKKKIKIN